MDFERAMNALTVYFFKMTELIYKKKLKIASKNDNIGALPSHDYI